MEAWEQFAGRLRVLREQRGLTQRELAERSGLTEQGLGQLERGRREPTWETVCRLASALGVECTAFTEGVTDQPADTAPRKAGRPLKHIPENPALIPRSDPPPAPRPDVQKTVDEGAGMIEQSTPAKKRKKGGPQ